MGEVAKSMHAMSIASICLFLAAPRTSFANNFNLRAPSMLDALERELPARTNEAVSIVRKQFDELSSKKKESFSSRNHVASSFEDDEESKIYNVVAKLARNNLTKQAQKFKLYEERIIA